MTAVLVTGPAHSGVPHLYSALKAALPRGLTVFGPRQPQQFEFISCQPHLCKLVATIGHRAEIQPTDLGMFDHVVVLRRDPRDRVLSAVLSDICGAAVAGGDTAVEALLAILRAKERSPASVSLGDIVDAVLSTMRRTEPEADLAVSLREDAYQLEVAADSRETVVRYEDLVGRGLEDLEARLAVRLPERWETPRHLSILDREPAPGSWRRWFTPEDVDRYRPLLTDQLVLGGYGDDWDVENPRQIDAAEASEMMQVTVHRARALPNRYDTLRSPDFYTSAFVEHLRAAMGDGDEGAMIEYALAHLVGYIAPASRDEYLRWMHAARRRRNPSALIHWGVALERLVASDRNHGPSHYFEEAAALIGNAAAKRRIEHVRSLYELHGVGSSTR